MPKMRNNNKRKSLLINKLVLSKKLKISHWKEILNLKKHLFALVIISKRKLVLNLLLINVIINPMKLTLQCSKVVLVFLRIHMTIITMALMTYSKGWNISAYLIQKN
jgi:hypothetical protein